MAFKRLNVPQWFKNMLAPSGNPADGAYLYAESGVLKIRQADGTIFTLIDAQPLDGDLTAIAAFAGTGIAVRTNTNVWAQRAINGTGKAVVTNGAGLAGNPSIDVPVDIPPVMRVYTATGVTAWAKPASAYFAGVWVELQGGGGGSGGCAATTTTLTTSGSGGGKGGAYARFWVPAASLASSENVTVGVGGTAGTAGANAGGTGGTTSFGAFGSAIGGSGGQGGAAAAPSFTSQDGGSTVQAFSGTATPVLFVAGADGGTGLRLASSISAIPGYGGGSHLGGAQKIGSVSSGQIVGQAGQNYGGGAAGPVNASASALSAKAGAAGAQGIAVVTEIYG